MQDGCEAAECNNIIVRPHQALQHTVPASRYQPSARRQPLTLAPIDYLSSDQVRIVKSKGEVTFRNQFFYIAELSSVYPSPSAKPIAQIPTKNFLVGIGLASPTWLAARKSNIATTPCT